jgi:transcriptional regulator with XRE-family HTH domain
MASTDPSDFGARLRSAREETGLTQEGLARRVDVPLRTYVRYEHGDSIPKGDALVRLARALGTTAEDLFPVATQAA